MIIIIQFFVALHTNSDHHELLFLLNSNNFTSTRFPLGFFANLISETSWHFEILQHIIYDYPSVAAL